MPMLAERLGDPLGGARGVGVVLGARAHARDAQELEQLVAGARLVSDEECVRDRWRVASGKAESDGQATQLPSMTSKSRSVASNIPAPRSRRLCQFGRRTRTESGVPDSGPARGYHGRDGVGQGTLLGSHSPIAMTVARVSSGKCLSCRRHPEFDRGDIMPGTLITMEGRR